MTAIAAQQDDIAATMKAMGKAARAAAHELGLASPAAKTRALEVAAATLRVRAGDIIVTGTPGGVGRYRDPQLFLEPGMTVNVEITNVGTLHNSVIDERP